MIEVFNERTYYQNGQLIPAREAGGLAPYEEARTGTMAYSILQAHNTSGDPEQLKIRFDAMASHDITYVGIIQTARASGLESFPLPYVLTNCHNSLCACLLYTSQTTRFFQAIGTPSSGRAPAVPGAK